MLIKFTKFNQPKGSGMLSFVGYYMINVSVIRLHKNCAAVKKSRCTNLIMNFRRVLQTVCMHILIQFHVRLTLYKLLNGRCLCFQQQQQHQQAPSFKLISQFYKQKKNDVIETIQTQAVQTRQHTKQVTTTRRIHHRTAAVRCLPNAIIWNSTSIEKAKPAEKNIFRIGQVVVVLRPHDNLILMKQNVQ